MECSVNKESYELVCKLANKFARGNVDSLIYEEYISAGLQGLENAVKSYNSEKGAAFKSFATTCIVNSISTCQRHQKKFDLTQDDNIEIESLDSLTVSIVEENMIDTVKDIIFRANNGNKRNAEMFMLNIGLNYDKMNYKELSAKFNVSAERVRQVCLNTRKNINANPLDKELLYSYVG